MEEAWKANKANACYHTICCWKGVGAESIASPMFERGGCLSKLRNIRRHGLWGFPRCIRDPRRYTQESNIPYHAKQSDGGRYRRHGRQQKTKACCPPICCRRGREWNRWSIATPCSCLKEAVSHANIWHHGCCIQNQTPAVCEWTSRKTATVSTPTFKLTTSVARWRRHVTTIKAC